MSDAARDLSRRDFMAAGGGIVAGSFLSSSPPRGKAAGQAAQRVAMVGTGIRGVSFWGRRVVERFPDVEFVGLCDINPGRVEFAKRYMGVECPTFTDFEEMIAVTAPERLIVTTVDSTHGYYIVRGMELGCDIITEKPMTTDEDKCQAILDAQARTGRDVVVTHNYRYTPHRRRMKELLMEERIGRITSVDFHWYLDVYHGADYFRRWHGKERFSGSLFVHKACHHFDLLNWWIDSEPEEVYAQGALEYYGHNNAFRSTSCRGCPHQEDCPHHWNILDSAFLTDLYVRNEHHDGYLRDGCVWSDEIDVYDKMGAQIRYANGVLVSYSCTTYSPYEGYRIAFNGTRGRLEAWIRERQPWEEPAYDELRVTDNFGETEILRIPHQEGGHGGGDTHLHDRVFGDPHAPDPFRQAAGVRDGAMAVLMGIAARKSVKSGTPIQIADLTSLTPLAQRP